MKCLLGCVFLNPQQMERKKKIAKKKIFTDRPTLCFPEQVSGNTQFIFLGLIWTSTIPTSAGPNLFLVDKFFFGKTIYYRVRMQIFNFSLPSILLISM